MASAAPMSPNGDGRLPPPVQQFEETLVTQFARLQDELVTQYARVLADLQDENDQLRRRLEALEDNGVEPSAPAKQECYSDDGAQDFPPPEDPEHMPDPDSDDTARRSPRRDKPYRRQEEQRRDSRHASPPPDRRASPQQSRQRSAHRGRAGSYQRQGSQPKRSVHRQSPSEHPHEYKGRDARDEISRRERPREYRSREPAEQHATENAPALPEYRKATAPRQDKPARSLGRYRSRSEHAQPWVQKSKTAPRTDTTVADRRGGSGSGGGQRRSSSRCRSTGPTRVHTRRSRTRSRSRQIQRGGAKGGSTTYSSGIGQKQCREGSLCFLHVIGRCRDEDCKGRHPDKEECKSLLQKMQNTPCRFGNACTRRGCVFRHPRDSHE
mmetsp:Transcript_57288/g.177548  ORF Transcript_57288/g.177548 Transcript_57288/m.177548 type:complete len:382 (-) Transcript_57288:59-1204(-)